MANTNLSLKEETFAVLDLNSIKANPLNPRKELGELTELSGSIKAQGLLQPLTVMDNEDGSYTLLIGHRRCAASKLAEITSVPCNIVPKMSEADQVKVMLCENIQREQLSVIDESQGFQMALDLGDTEDSIAKATGFCKQTVKRRINIAKLDQDKLKDMSSNYQLRLTDLYELDKLSSVEARNRVLNSCKSSEQISYAVTREIEAEKKNTWTKQIFNQLENAGIKKETVSNWWSTYNYKTIATFEYGKDQDVDLSKYKDKGYAYIESGYYNPGFRIIKAVDNTDKSVKTKRVDAEKEKLKKIFTYARGEMKDFLSNLETDKFKLSDEKFIDITLKVAQNLGVNYYPKTNNKDNKIITKENLVINILNNKIPYNEPFNGKKVFNKTTGDIYKNIHNIMAELGFNFSNPEYITLFDGTNSLYKKKKAE